MTRYGIKVLSTRPGGGGGYLAPLLKGTWGATFTKNPHDAWWTTDRDQAMEEMKIAADWCKVSLGICYFPDTQKHFCDVSAVNTTRPLYVENTN